jgi:hypothetical protein
LSRAGVGRTSGWPSPKSNSLVPVKMVHVRHVRMCVRQRGMPMGVRVGLAGRIERAVRVAMMLVVDMRCACTALSRTRGERRRRA